MSTMRSCWIAAGSQTPGVGGANHCHHSQPELPYHTSGSCRSSLHAYHRLYGKTHNGGRDWDRPGACAVCEPISAIVAVSGLCLILSPATATREEVRGKCCVPSILAIHASKTAGLELRAAGITTTPKTEKFLSAKEAGRVPVSKYGYRRTPQP